MTVLKRNTLLSLAAAGCLVLAGATGASAATEPGPAGPALAPTGVRAACDGNWHQESVFMDERYSPWMGSSPGTNFSRSIQFRALSGVNGVRGSANGAVGCSWQRARFWFAGHYRVTSCLRPAACRVGDWTPVQRSGGRDIGLRNDNANKGVGWDEFSHWWRLWSV